MATRRLLKQGLWLLLILLVLSACTRTVSPPAVDLNTQATLTVTQADDIGLGSLRQAILGASAGDTITFDPSLYGTTITLTGGELVLDKNLTITGPEGGTVTISGGGTFRVFQVASGTTATLRNLTITGGNSIGTLHNGYGGGTLNFGNLTVTNSTFSGNSATWGGGIYNNLDGSLTVTNSTFSGNSATWGGGIHNRNGTLTLENSTFSGNSATWGGGINNEEGTLTVTNSTFSGNSATWGGGINNNLDGSLTVANSIVALNTALWGSDVQGTIAASNSHNIIGGDPGLELDVEGTPKLADNGGPTKTIALTVGSRAIDAIPLGTNGCGTTISHDQRGVERPQGSGCDIGAFELETASAYHATGFYQPIGVQNSIFVPAPGTAPTPGPDTIWNVVKGGVTVPLKFNLYGYQGGPEITSMSGITFSQMTVACPSPSSSLGDDPVDFTTGDTSLRYDTADGQFIQSWKAPKVSRDTCYRASLTFADSSTLSAFFRLRK